MLDIIRLADAVAEEERQKLRTLNHVGELTIIRRE